MKSKNASVLNKVTFAKGCFCSIRCSILMHSKLDCFDGTNFTCWKDKLLFLLTELGVAYLLSGNLPAIPEPINDESKETKAFGKKREDDEIRCR
ncbi:conserved hypothetical protein [Ricinus communis]|uniref:Uncharacterized protein n=1 Tax=Ricinus communis TaxID=3988 RepID=B9T713_RICCO|nr:conserved hypothetical protein [Ricinus communis]